MKKKLIDIQTTLTQSEITILDNLIERYRYHKRCWKHFKRELNKKHKKASVAFKVDGKSTLKLEQLMNTFESKKMSLRHEIEERKQILKKVHEHREAMFKIGHEIKKIVLGETDHVKEQQARPMIDPNFDEIFDKVESFAKDLGFELDKKKTGALLQLIKLLK
jgi:hypothetical protein